MLTDPNPPSEFPQGLQPAPEGATHEATQDLAEGTRAYYRRDPAQPSRSRWKAYTNAGWIVCPNPHNTWRHVTPVAMESDTPQNEPEGAPWPAPYRIYQTLGKHPSLTAFSEAAAQLDHPYHELAHALLGAFDQASSGKGKERHANDLPFTEQKMQTIAASQGHLGGMVYQICKKALEAERMEPTARVRELQGVIVYAAGAIIYTDKRG